MTLSESYLFVLVISSVLFIPLGLAIRTLLVTKEHVILPILRLRITKCPNQTLVHGSSDYADESISFI